MAISRAIFSKNRAEEFPDDVWGNFVIPYYYEKVEVIGAKKSIRITGGRGCGKTMFIRYFCHPTTFSKSRKKIPVATLSDIGLYWRPHTQFCQLLSEEWLGKEKSRIAFLHYFSLILIVEFISSLKSIAESALEEIDSSILENEVPRYFDNLTSSRKIKNLNDLNDFCLDEQDIFETWVNNPDDELNVFLHPENSLKSLIRLIKKNHKEFEQSTFHVFIDEFENLQKTQQVLINDFIKHGKSPLIFHTAMKKNAHIACETSGFEQIVEVHDYRKYDIENLQSDTEFKILAAEIMLHRLEPFAQEEIIIDYGNLINPYKLNVRKNKTYIKKVIECAKNILPSITSKKISEDVLKNKSALSKLKKGIKKGLDSQSIKHNYKVNDFISDDYPEASIICSALLNRKKINADIIYENLCLYKDSKKSKFTDSTDWIGNNLYGCIFLIYKKLPHASCPLYSGFERYCIIARKNMRHFQELCHQAFLESIDAGSINFDSDGLPSILSNIQARAAVKISRKLTDEIKQFGHCGDQLHGLAIRLGSLFELAQRRESQSEPEVNHFSITTSDESRLSEDTKNILIEAKIWSVLIEDIDTKNKTDFEMSTSDYILNPIYAPKFGISYRKIRKLTFNANVVSVILSGVDEEWLKLLKSYEQDWNVSMSDQGTLF